MSEDPAAGANDPGWLEGIESELAEPAPRRTSSVEVRHPEVSGETPELDLPALKTFSLRGMLLHLMLSYRVATEGVGKGNGIVKDLYDELLRLSVEGSPELHLPGSALGKFPYFLKQPSLLNPEKQAGQVKVFWDKKCLLDAKSWLEGFVLGLSHSMVIVPLLSANGTTGSIGGMIGLKDNDYVDNVLLELILALELLNIGHTSVQAILPVLIGEFDGTKFKEFDFKIIDQLPDVPSQATNARAGYIMKQLGLPEDAIESMKLRSVKSVVFRITQMQGVSLSESASRGEAVTASATRVLETVVKAIKDVQSAPETFQFQIPMGAEVLDWLGRVSLRSYGPVFASHDLHSVAEIASLAHDDETLREICKSHDEMYPKRKKASIGDFVKLKKAVSDLKGCPEGMLLSQRLETFSDKTVSYRTCMFSACVPPDHSRLHV
ncbi:hypothetical protein T484DRAFT_1778889 [Baffinella frigidus]|nr:hypothetical protein T484DRAFT_1778889 [Cryptophyta sp. CCMP2293]